MKDILEELVDWSDSQGRGDTASLLLRAAREIERLRAALKPFATIADIYHANSWDDSFIPNDGGITLGQCRAALDALVNKETP